MTSRRYVIAYGDCFDWRVEKAPESYGEDLLTRKQTALRIIEEADVRIFTARITRRRAMNVLRAEQKKELS